MTLYLGITHLVVAIITILVSIPLTKDKVSMNKIYGIRIPIAYASNENWYRINRYGGKCLIGWSVPVMVIGIGLILAHFKWPISVTNIALITLFSLTPLIIVGALPQTLSWAKKHLPPSNSETR